LYIGCGLYSLIYPEIFHFSNSGFHQIGQVDDVGSLRIDIPAEALTIGSDGLAKIGLWADEAMEQLFILIEGIPARIPYRFTQFHNDKIMRDEYGPPRMFKKPFSGFIHLPKHRDEEFIEQDSGLINQHIMS
jgi:hypothetical protein